METTSWATPSRMVSYVLFVEGSDRFQPLLRQLKENGKFDDDDRDHHAQILTNNERRKLADWILACVDGHNPKDRVQVSSKIKEILRARHKYNQNTLVSGSFELNKP